MSPKSFYGIIGSLAWTSAEILRQTWHKPMHCQPNSILPILERKLTSSPGRHTCPIHIIFPLFESKIATLTPTLSIRDPEFPRKIFLCSVKSILWLSLIYAWEPYIMEIKANDEKSRALIAVTISFTFMSTVAVCMRLISRKLSSLRFWWDDGFIAFGLVGYSPGARHGCKVTFKSQFLLYGNFALNILGTCFD